MDHAADTDPPVEPLAVGVVDLGSNAIRVEIARSDDAGATQVVESQRATVSFGRDVFLTGSISDPTLDAAIEVLAGFRSACDRHGVSEITAIATAAMREAENRQDAVARIRSETGIDVSVISGNEEARLLVRAVRTRLDLGSGQSLLVDLGGGSVEVALIDGGDVVFVQSYPIGALRVLAALRDSNTAAADAASRSPGRPASGRPR